MEPSGARWPSPPPVTKPEIATAALTPWLPNQLAPTLTSLAADPFDLGWAERATAVAKGQLAAYSPPAFPATLAGIPAVALASPRPPGVCTNPFLVLPSEER